MSRIVLALLVVVAVLSATATAQNRECGPNEEFTSCGSSCPPTCHGKPQICTYNCVVGCQCKDGFLKNSQGNCVRQSEC